jgi:hypothetical protein
VLASKALIFTIDTQSVDIQLFSDARLSWSSHARRANPAYYETLTEAAHRQSWLAGEALLSCRRSAVRLMRHTVAMKSGSHCPQAVRC